MPLDFSKAKNGSLTCSFNGIFLHSAYNPENEAARFVENLKPDFFPQNIILIEPALSYAAPFLKKKFPTAKIFAIRFLNELNFKNCKVENCKTGNFNISNSDVENFLSQNIFTKEFFFTNEIQLKNDLFNYFSESELLNSFFISWPTSSKIFKIEDEKVWATIKDLLKSSQSILATRQFFANRWINNQINFFKNIKKTFTIKKINLPILICASGPSLKNCLNSINSTQNNFFIIACSSAIKVLLKNKIVPDLCISTDGGFYAKKHLNCLLESDLKIPIAISTESNIPQKLFEQNTIVPLAYCDNFDNSIFSNFNIDFNFAKRNGTISGTALELAFSLTDKNIFLCGIDLEAASGFCHTQPNELELDSTKNDFKLKNKETRIFIQSRENESLKIYRDWFINNSYKFENRVFRISNNYEFKNNLNNIKDINFDFFKKNFFDENSPNEKIFKNKNDFFTNSKSIKISSTEIKKIFLQLLESQDFIKNYFPADYIMIERSIKNLQNQNKNQNHEQKQNFREKINNSGNDKISSTEKYQNQLNKKLEKIRTRIENDL